MIYATMDHAHSAPPVQPARNVELRQHVRKHARAEFEIAIRGCVSFITVLRGASKRPKPLLQCDQSCLCD